MDAKNGEWLSCGLDALQEIWGKLGQLNLIDEGMEMGAPVFL